MPSVPAESRRFFKQLLESTQQKNILNGQAVHARIVKSYRSSCVHLANSLVNLYAKCGDLTKAKLVFDNSQQKDVVSWNCLINAFSQNAPSFSSPAVMKLLKRMREDDALPNAHTFAAVFAALSDDGVSGRQVHTLAIKTGSIGDVFVASSLLNLYCKAGVLFDARKMFDEMPERNSVSWATIISGYGKARMADEALQLFRVVRSDEKECDNEFLFTGVLSALIVPGVVDCGRQIHCLAVKNGLLSFVAVGNAIVTMYGKCGSLNDALKMFKLSDDKNSITWSAIVTGFAQSGDYEKALRLFSTMHACGVTPSEFTFVGVINSCSNIGDIEVGKQLHCYSYKLGFESQMYVMTALVDMYAKCGSISNAWKGV